MDNEHNTQPNETMRADHAVEEPVNSRSSTHKVILTTLLVLLPIGGFLLGYTMQPDVHQDTIEVEDSDIASNRSNEAPVQSEQSRSKETMFEGYAPFPVGERTIVAGIIDIDQDTVTFDEVTPTGEINVAGVPITENEEVELATVPLYTHYSITNARGVPISYEDVPDKIGTAQYYNHEQNQPLADVKILRFSNDQGDEKEAVAAIDIRFSP